MSSMGKVKLVQSILSFVFVAFVLVIAIYKGPKLLEAYRKVRLDWIAAGLLCYLINYLFRSIRLIIISSSQIKFWPDSVYAVCTHGLASYMLPFRTGDLTLPVILRTVSGIRAKEGGKMLLKARLLDFTILGAWMVCAAAFFHDSIPFEYKLTWFSVGLSMSFAPVIVKRIGMLAKARLKGFLYHISVFETVGKISLLELAISFGVWGSVGACFYCTTRAIGLTSLGIGDIWFIISVQLPLQVIPLQGVANAGNHETGWVAALALIGIPASQGLVFALTSHTILFSYVLTLGFIALLAQKKA